MQPSHSHAVMLLFDAGLEKGVRQLREDLSVPNLPHRPDWTTQLGPHISLGGGWELESLDWSAIVAALPPLPEIHLENVGVFSGGGMVFLAPRVTLELLSYHQAFYDAASEARVRWLPHYLPGRWTPHCTMLQGLGPGQAGQVAEQLSYGIPLAGRCVNLALYTLAAGDITVLTN